ncbi:MAG TPA: deacetylase, partial [Ktedonobacter sp.]|nr:deacetylase [Ktedonobacter sp.]
DRDYIQDVQNASEQMVEEEAKSGYRTGFFATDTYVSAKSYEAAAKAAGAPLTALDAMMRGEIDNAYCLVRPPGHHALPDDAMGFCIF